MERSLFDELVESIKEAGKILRNEVPLISVTIADCDVQTFRAGGKGGQHQNTTETGVRIIHRPSGATGEARDSRSQGDNKRAAFRRMAGHPKFKAWVNRIAHEKSSGMTLEEAVEDQMHPNNIRVEVHTEGGWVVEES